MYSSTVCPVRELHQGSKQIVCKNTYFEVCTVHSIICVLTKDYRSFGPWVRKTAAKILREKSSCIDTARTSFPAYICFFFMFCWGFCRGVPTFYFLAAVALCSRCRCCVDKTTDIAYLSRKSSVPAFRISPSLECLVEVRQAENAHTF